MKDRSVLISRKNFVRYKKLLLTVATFALITRHALQRKNSIKPPTDVYFMHVHKTAGTALWYSITNGLQDNTELCWNKADPSSQNTKEENRWDHSCKSNVTIQKIQRESIQFNFQNTCHAVQMHLDSSIFPYMRVTEHNHKPKSLLMFTILREPSARTWSAWWFGLKGKYPDPDMPKNSSFSKVMKDTTISDRLAYGGPRHQSLMLSGVLPLCSLKNIETQELLRDPLNQDTLERIAIRNLRQFDFVGIHECPEETLQVLSKMLGFQVSMLNEDLNPSKKPEFSDDLRQKTNELFSSDNKVYQEAKKLFRNKLRQLGIQPSCKELKEDE